jgi:hypothetical protein
MNNWVEWSTIIGSVWFVILAGIVVYALNSNRSFRVSLTSLRMFTFTFETTDLPVSGVKITPRGSKGR